MDAMCAKILLFLVSALCYAGCQNSNGTVDHVDNFFGYELLEHQLECLQLKVSEVMSSLAKNKITADARMDDLNAKILASNSSLLNRLSKLETAGDNILKNQRSAKNLAMDIATNQTNLLERLTKLGDTIARDQKSTNQHITNITASVATLNKQSEYMLKKTFWLGDFSCSDDGVYKLQIPNINVRCISTVSDGSWLVIQQRLNRDLSFDRNWNDYRNGFGTVGTDFWLGLEAIHQITSSRRYNLHVELRSELGEKKFAYYSQFRVAGEDDHYRLTVGGYGGTAGDELSSHNKRSFSTRDMDYDTTRDRNCAEDSQSGWWFRNCGTSNLNGPAEKNDKGYGIKWGSFTSAGTYSLMMIRVQD